MANEIYHRTWWGNAIDTAITAGTEPDFFGSQMKMLTSQQPELVTNGDFATDSNWTKGTGWTISGGKANSDGVSGASALYQNIGSPTIGKTYKIQFEVVNYTSGTLVAAYGGASATSVTSAGVFTFYVEATSTDANTSYLSYSFNGSIDNV